MRRVSVDIGGTFTDCFVVWDGKYIEAKALTTHHNLALGFNEALSKAYHVLGLRHSEGWIGYGGRIYEARFLALGDRSQFHFALDNVEGKAGDYKVPIALWLRADGSVERFELQGSAGDTQTDEQLKQAMNRFKGFRTPPPPNMVWPMRLQLTNRMAG